MAFGVKKIKFKQIACLLGVLAICLHASVALVQEAHEARKARQTSLSLEEITQSNAAKLFRRGDYEHALTEFEKLSRQYPQESIFKRYTGMTLTLLGRLDDAATALEEAAALEPDNPANHYYLARVYHEQGARDKAESELKLVIDLDPEGYYGIPAAQALPLVQEASIVRKKWDLWASVGYEYDSNVPLASDDEALVLLDDKSAGRAYASLGGTYTVLERGRFDSKIGYHIYQSFHDDDLGQFDYFYQSFSWINRYRFQWLNREMQAGIRFNMPLGFLHSDLFLYGPEAVTYMNARLTPQTFTEVYLRYAYYDFGPDGSDPGILSRDGVYGRAGIYHRVYFDDQKTYLSFAYEFQDVQTEGKNFDRIVHVPQIGFLMPLNDQLDFDILGQLYLANHPHYTSELFLREPLSRLDINWTALARLTYKITKNWSVQAFYRYDTANNRNDLFDYERHIAGAQLTFRF